MIAPSRYRSFFLKNTEPPYYCTFCGKVLTAVEVVHHLDGDRMNASLGNLASAHDACHRAHHNQETKTGVPQSPEHVEKRLVKVRGQRRGRTPAIAAGQAKVPTTQCTCCGKHFKPWHLALHMKGRTMEDVR